MSNTQGKKTTGGSFATITTTATGLVSNADATVAAMPAAVTSEVSAALNEWHNCAGVGTAAQIAQKYANAAGVTIQEV
jgi:hypothetical protein